MKSSFPAPLSRLSVNHLLILGLLLTSVDAIAQSTTSTCGDLHSGGDYRTSSRQALNLVENFHFTPEVEALIRGKSTTDIGADLSYTLVAFPNHHRALMSMMLLGKKFKTPQPKGAQFNVECYFLRALRFRPDDTTARMMYASYLSNQARVAEASKELAQVGEVAGDNAFTFYNMGQIYFDLKNYDKALENAHKAYGLGLTLTGLRERLTRAGYWRDADLAASSPAMRPASGVESQ
ncbi:MAG: ABC transporter permease [Candidatus Saccharibacteria bacterium]|nr:ABC transporter permease [Rhodoferax sp.]